MNGSYDWDGNWQYVAHATYAPDATHYLRAFSILQADLLRLFEYIEPADANETTYSYRCLELLLRACGEVEANCKAILDANSYESSKQLTMLDYHKLDATHRLSSYRVRLPVWTGSRAVRTPFDAWKSTSRLPWFQAHHGGKHNRHDEFPAANLGNAVDAIAAVVVILAAQFFTYDFEPVHLVTGIGQRRDGFERAIGGYFEVAFPTDWPIDDRHDFIWNHLEYSGAPLFATLAFP